MIMLDGVKPPPGDTIEGAIARAVEHAHSEGIVADILDGDGNVNGTAYRQLDQDAWSTIASISIERHYALNWLAGYATDNDWDATPTDT